MNKKEIFIQDSVSSCAATCILSLVVHFGGYVPLETIKADTLTDKNGTSAYQVKRVLENYGFISNGLRIKLKDIKPNHLPAIAHVTNDNIEHFVVIYEIKDKYITVMDPAYGKRIYSLDDFSKIYNNILITAYPKTNIIHIIEHSPQFYSTFKLKNTKLFGLYILSLILFICEIINSLYMQIIKDNISSFIFIVLLLTKSFISFVINKIIINNSINAENNINLEFYKHVLNLDEKTLDSKRIGEVLKISNDNNYIKDFYYTVILNVPLNILALLVCMFFMFLLHKILLLVILICVLMFILVSYFFSKKIYKDNVDTYNLFNTYYGKASSITSNYKSIKNLKKENYFINKINRLFLDYSYANKKLLNKNNTNSSLKTSLLSLIILLINILGYHYVKSGMISFKELVTYLTIYALFNESLVSITDLFPSIIHYKAIKSRVIEFMNLKEHTYPKNKIAEFSQIDIKNLSYTYDYYDYIFKNISFNIQKGDKLLLKGESGKGKSTLVKCLCGIYSDYKGKILIDNKDSKKYDISNLFMYVGQDENLFEGSIKENLLFDDNIEYDDIIKICMLDDIIDKKRNKIDTYILEGSTNISGGEKMRIILARALLKKPKVLILDETLSSVSEEMEDKILSNLLKLEDLTLVYITHRNKDKYFKKIINI